MDFILIDQKLINAWLTLVLAEKKTLEQVPDKYREEVSIRIAERTISVLE